MNNGDCPWRMLMADGEVLVCNGWHELGAHRFGNDDTEREVDAYEDDPCAWDATCPDCHGRKWANRDPARKHGKNTPCPDCEGAGIVDTIPDALIGVGSVLETAMGNRVTIVSRHWAKHGAWRVYDDDDGAFVLGVVADEDIGSGRPWRVVRAVPPVPPDEEDNR